MLFDSRSIDHAIAVGTGRDWQPPRVAAARHRSAAGFLSLPALDAGVPAAARLYRRDSASFNEFALAQFRYGPLRAADVSNPISSRDAFVQAFSAWVGRQLPDLDRMRFSPRLFAGDAVNDEIQYLDSRDEFEDSSPLYLAFEMDGESVYSIGEIADVLHRCHPLLVYTLLSVIDRAGFMTLWVRTPGWYLYEFACHHWDGDEVATDAEIEELFKGNGWIGADARRYLPSNVYPELYPDKFRKPERLAGRRRRSSTLSEHELLALRAKCSGVSRRICTELIHLSRLMRHPGRRSPLGEGFSGCPLYASCAVVLSKSDLADEVVDDYFNYASQGSDYTTCDAFVPLAQDRVSIRRQYAGWTLAFRIIRHLDRLLALVAQPLYGA